MLFNIMNTKDLLIIVLFATICNKNSQNKCEENCKKKKIKRRNCDCVYRKYLRCDK